MLIGRGPESERLESLLAAARGGKSGALVLHGDAGVGKTVLLADAVGRADGFVVLRVQPLEVESELPFAGLSDLVRPIAHLLERIPQPQAEALAGALALGPPTPGDRFAAAAATLSLLATAASSAPVLAVVDDAHWLDAPSREAIVFAGRRLSNEGVVLLLAMRDRPWLSGAGLETMPIGGLPHAAAAELVDRARPAISQQVRDRVIVETGGNPLAILETLAALSEAQVDGSEPLAGPIPVGARIEEAFGEQVRDLPSATRRALLVVAASDSGDLYEIDHALNAVGLGSGDLKSAEQLRLISLMDGRVEFRHPLLRSATYQGQGADERREAHSALAASIESSEPDRIAWHLAAAATGPDESVAARLERAGIDAKARRGHSAASKALEIAARLSPARKDRTRRLLAAAEAAYLANEGDRALGILDGLLADADGPISRADIQVMRALALLMRQPLEETRKLLEHEAALIEPHDAGRAAAMLVLAHFGSMMAGEVERALGIATRSRELAISAGSPVAASATAALGSTLALLGDTTRGRELLESLRPLLDGLDPVGEAGNLMWVVGLTFMGLEDWDTARQLLDRIVLTARATAAPDALPRALAGLSELEFRSGNLASAYAAANEAVGLSIDTGQDVSLPYALQALARVEAALGHDEDCRLHAEASLSAARQQGVRSIEEYATAALGLLELGRGRPAEAIRFLESVERSRSVSKCTQVTVQSAGDLIEAYAQCGQTDEAERQLAELAAETERTGLRWAMAVVARYRGMLAPDGDFEALFEEALAIHAQGPSRFEVARTELSLGRRRRHARRRTEARRALHSALAAFEALGAEPWAEQARVELRATGEVPAPSTDSSLRDLTPQELQVALIVAKGATNNETAAALFLSPKTVEFHLHNTYGKLGVRSRTELVRKVGLEAQG